MTGPCEVCGQPVPPKLTEGARKGHPRRYCSERCRHHGGLAVRQAREAQARAEEVGSPMTPALERRYRQHLAWLRAARPYGLDPWAQRESLLARWQENGPDTSGMEQGGWKPGPKRPAAKGAA